MKKRAALALFALAITAILVGYTTLASRGADDAASPIFLTEMPQGYRDFKLISVSRLTAGNGSQLRAELGNDIALAAYREGKLPFPDGAIIAALHWKEAS